MLTRDTTATTGCASVDFIGIRPLMQMASRPRCAESAPERDESKSDALWRNTLSDLWSDDDTLFLCTRKKTY